MRIEVLPPPSVGAHVGEAAFSPPAEKGSCLAGIGVTGCDVAGPTRRNFVRHPLAAGLLEGPHHLQHAVAGPGSEIDREAFCLVLLIVRARPTP